MIAPSNGLQKLIILSISNLEYKSANCGADAKGIIAIVTRLHRIAWLSIDKCF
jgi:hypothetical protein